MKPYEVNITQVDSEFSALISLFKDRGVRRFLEIGSRFGGSLWRIANALPRGSLIVSVDSGKGMGGSKPGAQDSLVECVADLKVVGYNTHLFVGHSQSDHIIRRVKGLLPFDAVFIDGDHELEGVTADWVNYGPMAPIVAFHDIAFVAPPGYDPRRKVEVPVLWGRLKVEHEHMEFIDPTGNMGIGVIIRG